MSAELMASLKDALDPGHTDVVRVGKVLESFADPERLQAIRAMTARQQAALFEAAQGHVVTLDDLVPPNLGPLVPVICEGKNSLPFFTTFQKRFCRSVDAPRTELFGYNHQTMSWMTGPGYFVAHQDGAEVAIDYTRVPTAKPADWPAIAPNTGPRNSLAFGGLVDYLRKVSDHVAIGRATRRGKTLDNWFVLTRVDPVRS